MTAKKCLSIGPSDDLSKPREVLRESQSLEALKSKGFEHAESHGLENPEWEDVSYPVMGDDKLSSAVLRYTMNLEDGNCLLIE
ncbi:hypothetical protein HMF8227_00316 [Saliniradius amylolyticus]|uniref:Uncharacterized protein n=1 Tax=Saliniradius amylolyticus TaxID=2183582 RepID=A0A2S2DZV9_9ALTE|nr:hypothetical protein [Saliniradius amylolyticus]AWL10822.1 hypothetical protein HMF8227_00316 [Saliniradius amylolyticus]